MQEQKQPQGDPRDARENMSDEERRRLTEKQEQNEQSEQQEPGDPEQPRGQGDPSQPETAPPSEDRAPAWVVSLPAQWRDAYVRGDFEKIPAEYRELIERYLIWLQKEAGREARGTR